MKRLRLITGNRLAIISAMLCIAIIALALRSFWRFDMVNLETCRSNNAVWTGDGYELASLHGVLWFRHYHADFPPGKLPPENLRNRIQGPFLHVRRTTVMRLNPPSDGPLVGIGAGLSHSASADASGAFSSTHYIVPHWLAATLLAVLPIYMLMRLLRSKRRMRRRIENDLCPFCGYDLRASPDLCPECGTLPSGNRQSKSEE